MSSSEPEPEPSVISQHQYWHNTTLWIISYYYFWKKKWFLELDKLLTHDIPVLASMWGRKSLFTVHSNPFGFVFFLPVSHTHFNTYMQRANFNSPFNYYWFTVARQGGCTDEWRGKPCTESTDIANNLPIWPLREMWEVQVDEVNLHKNIFPTHSNVCYRKTVLLLPPKRGRTPYSRN